MCFSCENYRKFTVITDVLIQFFLEGSCSLHVDHGAFKTGFKSVPWDVQNSLKAMFNLFHDAPS